MTDELKYPIGRFHAITPATLDVVEAAIAGIAALPAHLREAVRGLADDQLDTPYRPGGWTVRQVAHHVADSHMNGFIRLKLALTEDNPTIKPYDENAWSELPDVRLPVDVSLDLVEALHHRWVSVYRALEFDRFGRTFFHPESNATYTIGTHVQLYAWHGRHHVAHITSLRQRQGW